MQSDKSRWLPMAVASLCRWAIALCRPRQARKHHETSISSRRHVRVRSGPRDVRVSPAGMTRDWAMSAMGTRNGSHRKTSHSPRELCSPATPAAISRQRNPIQASIKDQARAWGFDDHIGIRDRHDVSVAHAQRRSNASASQGPTNSSSSPGEKLEPVDLPGVGFVHAHHRRTHVLI